MNVALPLLVVVVVVLGERFCRLFGGEHGEVGGSTLHWLPAAPPVLPPPCPPVLAGWVAGAHGACAAWIGLAPAGFRRRSYLQATTGLVDDSPPPRGFGSRKKTQINYTKIYK